MRWPDNVFISGGNPHLTSRFYGVVLGPTTISKIVSEPIQNSLGHMLLGFRYRATHHLCLRIKPCNAGREGVCYEPSQFYGVVLDPTTISKMVSEPLQDPLGHMLSGFRYRTSHQLCLRTKPSSAGREGVC
jgi:hypothetical protein